MVFSPINLLLGAQDDAQLGGMFLERSQEKGGRLSLFYHHRKYLSSSS